VNGIIASPFGVNHMMANLYYNIHRFIYILNSQILKSKWIFTINEAFGIVVPIFGSV
jgi:hypothetical protein